MSLLVIGECMVELRPNGLNPCPISFAGDTYNTAIYAKRCNPNITVSFLSAVGDDPFSQTALNHWQEQGLDCSHIKTFSRHTIGMYGISTDENGERSFSYWRKGSAASKMFDSFSVAESLSALSHYNMVYLSGISVAILNDESKGQLLNFVVELKSSGVKVVFDPNYRPQLWQNRTEAKKWLTEFYAISDILLPGLEDHEDLFNQKTKDEVHNFLTEMAIGSFVIKCGLEGTYIYQNGEMVCHQPFTPAPIQIDSTAAGDSFAGGYIAGLLSGLSPQQSLKQATKIASAVVQHPGAIVPPEVIEKALDTTI